jgi:hypothetical protein
LCWFGVSDWAATVLFGAVLVVLPPVFWAFGFLPLPLSLLPLPPLLSLPPFVLLPPLLEPLSLEPVSLEPVSLEPEVLPPLEALPLPSPALPEPSSQAWGDMLSPEE